MIGGRGLSLAGLFFLLQISVVQADDDNAGVIAASVVAGVLVLIAFAALTIFCFYKRKGFTSENKKKRHKKVVYVPNGVPPQVKHRKHHRPHHYRQNDKHQPNGIPHIPPPPMVRPYDTYHGPPPGLYPEPLPMKHGTITGPPPVVVIPTPHGTVAMRPDPRPIVHKRDHRYHSASKEDEQRRHKRSRSRPPSEYIIEHSPDGIPVIRPVIYIDDDKNKHRSKSRDRKHKSRDQTPSGAQITEIKVSDTEGVTHTVEEVEVHKRERSRSRSKSRTPPPRTPQSRLSPDRSRASSVTEAVNALRMSVRQHGSKDIDTDTASELDSPRPLSSEEQRAPDPVAGDVLFYPAGAHPPALRETHVPDLHNAPDTTDQVYSYTKVIKSNTIEHMTEETGMTQDSSSPAPLRSSAVERRGSPEVTRSSMRANYLGTRDEEPEPYETEHTVQSTSYVYTGDIRASMSDRITSLVEDGDKTRFSHYNVGAVTLGEESDEDEEMNVQLRTKRPATPPNDIRSSFYSKPRRPTTPPNDIPLITPTESAEIPRLDLQSSSATPRVMHLYRPESPPRDFPITPQSSIIRPRPSTPPFDIDTHRESMLSNRSEAVNPATGEPGSFQARKRLIEAHLKTQVDADKGNTNVKVTQKSPQVLPRSEPSSQTQATITITPGVIPPAPPPPPIK